MCAVTPAAGTTADAPIGAQFGLVERGARLFDAVRWAAL